MKSDKDRIADAIWGTLHSPNVVDANFETGNIVDAVDNLAKASWKIAHAIAADAAPGSDALGGHVDSLTEAVMGVTGGLVKIAEAIQDLADAVSEKP